jgi:hypothetical protein
LEKSVRLATERGEGKGEGDMKHFNRGFVWGRVVSLKKEYSRGGTPYLAIQVECPNEMHGDIKTYGRLWNEEKINAFLDYQKAHPGQAYRFQGYFSQYDKDEGLRYSNYTFISWVPVDHKEFRATFILLGEITATEAKDGEGKLYIHLLREGGEGYKDIEEDFEVYFPNTQDISGIEEGSLIKVKGLLMRREPEDYFGDSSSSPVKAYVKEHKIIKDNHPEEVTSQEVF